MSDNIIPFYLNPPLLKSVGREAVQKVQKPRLLSTHDEYSQWHCKLEQHPITFCVRTGNKLFL